MLLLEIGKRERIELAPPDFDDIEKLTNKVRDICSGADHDKMSEMCVIIDELVNNYISYSFTGVENPHLSVDVEYINGTATLTFTNNGVLFNPIEAKPIDVDVDISERTPGGVGIMLVKQFSEKMEYSVVDGKNELKIIKKMTVDNNS
ncbi:MAG: ATP-binding protein [Clostridiales bacterium]|nr:ATP-binding protein [Clostridiales bacterium]